MSKKRAKRLRRRARREAAGKTRPVKAFIQRGLARLSRKLFGRNIFKQWFDSPRQPKGTKPNPPWNAATLQAAAQESAQTPPQETSQPRE